MTKRGPTGLFGILVMFCFMLLLPVSVLFQVEQFSVCKFLQ